MTTASGRPTILRADRQYSIYAVLGGLAIVLTLILIPTSGADFRRFFGAIPPLLAVLAATALGGVSLYLLKSRGRFEVFRGRVSLRGIALSAVLATLLAVAIVLADLILRYPEGMNVPFPRALLFYPAVGFVAEVAFHVLPLTLLLLLARLGRRIGEERLVWLCLVLVAVAEPIFQVTFEPEPHSWIAAYTGVHVFAIALLQLYLFRRYDFVTMFAFRLFYYAYWHLAWGVLRLQLLF